MEITISIKTDNAAFTDWPENEVARILAGVVQAVLREGINATDGTALFDINGNNVGTVTIKE